MRNFMLSFVLLFIHITISAQDCSIPKDYKFDSPESYQAYEPQIKEVVDWYLNTSLGKEALKRQEAVKFIMEWIAGTSNITVGIDGRIVNFIGKNPELLMPFIAGWIKFGLDNDYSKDLIDGNVAGVETVVAYYNKNKGYLKKESNLDKYAKLIEKGKLREDIEKKLKNK